MEYVAGFMFSHDNSYLGLIKKTKPEWQKGKLNGIGGKIEVNETPLEAMIREFREETGYHHEAWDKFCMLKGDWGTVYFFKAHGDLTQLNTMEEEEIKVLSVEHILALSKGAVANLSWLIPMAIHIDDVRENFYTVEEHYK